jgi:hypothetical protein
MLEVDQAFFSCPEESGSEPVLNDEHLLETMYRLETLGLHMPETADTAICVTLDDEELKYVAHEVNRIHWEHGSPSPEDVRYVNALFSVNPLTNEKEVDPKVLQKWAQVKKDYEGVVLGSVIPLNPPKRGPYGEAYIPLVGSFEPTRTRPFQMFAEKREAHKILLRTG